MGEITLYAKRDGNDRYSLCWQGPGKYKSTSSTYNSLGGVDVNVVRAGRGCSLRGPLAAQQYDSVPEGYDELD